MKKKYSDPLMFSSTLLTGITVTHSQEGTIGGGDDWDDDANGTSGLRVNASPSQQTSDPVTIVNPVEEAVNSTDVNTEEISGTTSTTSSPLGAEAVIDGLVPDGSTASSPSAGE